jgi:hypothetical protein
VALAAPGLPGSTKLGEVLTIVLAYAATAFGFSVAGLTVALTLPDAAFVHELATKKPTGKFAELTRKPNAYSDLLLCIRGQRLDSASCSYWGLVSLQSMVRAGGLLAQASLRQRKSWMASWCSQLCMPCCSSL